MLRKLVFVGALGAGIVLDPDPIVDVVVLALDPAVDVSVPPPDPIQPAKTQMAATETICFMFSLLCPGPLLVVQGVRRKRRHGIARFGATTCRSVQFRQAFYRSLTGLRPTGATHYAARMTYSAEIFMTGTPGLESALLAEAQANGFADARRIPGGVTFNGGWEDVWRANLTMRGATRILVRIGSFMAFHLAQLDKRAKKFPWAEMLRPDIPLRVEVVTSRKSKIYHAGAATQRIEDGLKANGYQINPDAPIAIKARIDDNRVTISIDTSGESLHKRGHKEAVGKAPMRETLAALMLRECGYDGREPVLDPMCGSGTFVIEAAEIAAGLLPGRTRRFAFEQLASFDADAWNDMRQMRVDAPRPAAHFHGSDRDAGAVRMATANAERAGVGDLITFANLSATDLQRPDGPPGLIICNPPYGGRIGNQKMLYGIYAGLGETLKSRFAGWRVGLVTSEAGLAKATGLPFKPKGAPIPHGGLKVWLFQSEEL